MISRMLREPLDPFKRFIMKKLCLLLCVSLGISVSAMAEGDAEAGKAKSAVCAACHGPDGNSMIDMNPKIAGQHEKYLVKQLMEFKLASQTGGEEGRNNAVMNGNIEHANFKIKKIKNKSIIYINQKNIGHGY